MADDYKLLTKCFWGVPDPDSFLASLREVSAPLGESGMFCGDNLVVFGRNLSFLRSERFMKAFRASISDDNYVGHGIIWRLYTLCWAANSCLRREGDFVECGVFSGASSGVMCQYLGFESLQRKLYLYDTFGPHDSIKSEHYPGYDDQLYKFVCQRFAPYSNVRIIQGFIPDSFQQEIPEKIAFLHVDLNNAPAEIATLNALFDRVSPGGMVLLDDYGFSGFLAQKQAEDEFFAQRGYEVLELPTGQGLVIK